MADAIKVNKALIKLREIITIFTTYVEEESEHELCLELSENIMLKNKELFLTELPTINLDWSRTEKYSRENMKRLLQAPFVDSLSLLNLKPLGEWTPDNLIIAAEAIEDNNFHSPEEIREVVSFFVSSFSAMEELNLVDEGDYVKLICALGGLLDHGGAYPIINRHIEDGYNALELLQNARGYSVAYGVPNLLKIAPYDIKTILSYSMLEPNYVRKHVLGIYNDAVEKGNGFQFLSELIYLHYNKSNPNSVALFESVDIFNRWNKMADQNDIDTNSEPFKRVIMAILNGIDYDDEPLISPRHICRFISNCNADNFKQTCSLLNTLYGSKLLSTLNTYPGFNDALEDMVKNNNPNDFDFHQLSNDLKEQDAFDEVQRLKSIEETKNCLLSSLQSFEDQFEGEEQELNM